jgi:hypothetical protein
VYSVELRYMRKLSDMTLSTSTPTLDEQWHWGVALKAAELLAALGSDATVESRNARRYATWINTMRQDQTRKRMDPRGMYATYARDRR